MMPRHSIALVSVTAALLSGPAFADVSEFSSYDECILESLKGVSSDVAANAIIASCRSTFPETAPLAAEPAEPAPEAAALAPEPEPPPEQQSIRPEEAVSAAAAASVAATSASGENRELTKEELRNLKSTLFGFTTKYQITFENFNDAITITEVTIAVWDDLDPRGLKKYTKTMHVPPQQKAKVTYEVIYMGDDEGWRWKIDSAKGVPLAN